MPGPRRFFLAALLVSVLVVGGCGSDAPPTPVATAGPDTGTVALHGVVSMDGKPVRGAFVVATLWPEDTSDVPEGGVVDTLDLPTVTTGDDGAYVVRIDPDRLASRYFGGDYLNVDLRFSTTTSMSSWSTTVDLVDDRVWRSTDRARVGDPVLRLDVDLGRRTITTEDSLGEKEKSDLPVY
ncbi:hypothetical protein AERO_08640 [Aeromicrobium fastidiosum]|uniref:hypothetical protein n=1 Tax=Aeromicrobium fastidiosum TaxID=52699 RepID=UPI00202342B0|nr:hypothetical protein [Aeromicrobium fastidiosum]MCL8251450.1 hypothetical protein [Aeromicrobium fastidiosum]